MALLPSDAIVPQEAIGCGTPKPKKLKNASVKIALGIVNVIVTKMAPNAFGIKCFEIICPVEAPSVRAAKTYS